MVSRSKTVAYSSMLSAAALCLGGAPVAMVEVLVVEAIPRAQPLVGQLVQAASVLLPALAALEVVVAASAVASAGAAAVEVVVADLAATEEGSVVDSAEAVVVEEVVEVALAEAEEVSATSQTATDPPTVLLLVPAPLEVVALEATVEATAEVEVGLAAIAVGPAATKTDAAAAEAATTAVPAAPTTSPSAAEIATATVTVGTAAAVAAATTAHESVATKATATTIRDSEGGTKLLSTYSFSVFCMRKGLSKVSPIPFSSHSPWQPFSSTRVRSHQINHQQ